MVANIFNGKIEAFRKAFFLSPPETNLNNIKNIIYPDPVLINKIII